jgi:hypothetical protein
VHSRRGEPSRSRLMTIGCWMYLGGVQDREEHQTGTALRATRPSSAPDRGAFEKLENLNLVNTKFQVIANSLMIAHQFLLVKAKAVKEKLAAYLVEEE